jgi:hypothetical protein
MKMESVKASCFENGKNGDDCFCHHLRVEPPKPLLWPGKHQRLSSIRTAVIADGIDSNVTVLKNLFDSVRAGVGRCQPITVDFGIPLCRASNRFNRHDQRRHKRRQGAVTLDDVSHLPITKLLYQWRRRDSDMGVTIRHVGPQLLPES